MNFGRNKAGSRLCGVTVSRSMKDKIKFEPFMPEKELKEAVLIEGEHGNLYKIIKPISKS